MTDFATFYRTGPHRRFPQEHRRLTGTPARLIEVRQGSHALGDAATDDHVLGVTLSGTASARWSWGDRWRSVPRRTRGLMGVSPARQPGLFEVSGDHRLLLLTWPASLSAALRTEAALGAGDDLGIVHDRYVRDPVAFALVTALWEEARTAGPRGSLFADHALRTLVLRLATMGGRRRPIAGPTPGLAAAELARLDEWILRHLASAIRVDELAEAVSRPAAGFVGAFRDATGLRPDQYVAGKRVERARHLIDTTDLPLERIAVECGFTHQAHLTRWFTRLVGVPPGAYRQQRRIGSHRV